MTCQAHVCADHRWPGWGPCSGCGADRVACTSCSTDLTDHSKGCLHR